MLGVLKLVVPVPFVSTLPPVAAAYQSIVSPAPTLALPAMLPPTDVGDTVTVAVDENVESHTPDLITAL